MRSSLGLKIQLSGHVNSFNILNLQFLMKMEDFIYKVEKILKGSLDDPITFTFSENSNYGRERLLEVIRQNIAG